jgi:hypothetical protein
VADDRHIPGAVRDGRGGVRHAPAQREGRLTGAIPSGLVYVEMAIVTEATEALVTEAVVTEATVTETFVTPDAAPRTPAA